MQLLNRRDVWMPPERPEWVSRVNAEGGNLDISAVVPLDERSLLDTASRNTGLNDFGDDEWREPFQILIKSLEEESRLNLIGRMLTRSDLLGFLQARLQIEDTYKRHPEIDDQRIERPLIITGYARTGTSALQYLLGSDPGNGTTKTWEVVFPCPPPTKESYSTDTRIERADRWMTLWNRVNPALPTVHEINGEIATESIQLQALNFISPAWLGLLGQIPSYHAHVSKLSVESTYRYEKRVLKLLQWKNPRRHWVLKAPDFLPHLPELLKVYPDACLIWCHRDPVVAMSSIINTIGQFNWLRSDYPFINSAFEEWTRADLIAGMLSQPIGWIERGIVPREQLCNVQYRDFIKDPIAVARRIYSHFGIAFTEDADIALQSHLAAAWHAKRPRHRYDIPPAEAIAEQRVDFQRYQSYFDVPNEV